MYIHFLNLYIYTDAKSIEKDTINLNFKSGFHNIYMPFMIVSIMQQQLMRLKDLDLYIHIYI